MRLDTPVILAGILPIVAAQTDTVLGVYLFHRHGDRTPKILPPANLTTLGYQQVYNSGQYFRNRYIAADAKWPINGVNVDIVKQSQIVASAPDDTVLQNSATGFLQGLYPPVPTTSETLRGGRQIQPPMNGYQLIPLEQVSAGGGSEDNTWLQSSQGCLAATVSSNEYFSSREYNDLLSQTQGFYKDLLPVINSTFTASQANFKNAYTIFDYVNVANIHNTTITSDALLTNETLRKLQLLANQHEWGLAYNGTSDERAIAGKVLAGEIIQFLNTTIIGKGKQKIGIQFGAYATFASFFGLVGLPVVSADFEGIVDYASVMAFELFAKDQSVINAQNYPAASEMYVRFLFHNGTASNSSEPTVYPLFGSGMNEMRWSDFEQKMQAFAISNTQQWCQACGNSTGKCAQLVSQGQGTTSINGDTTGNGLSPALNGVIGAMTTLVVILGLQALILLAGGLRVVRKQTFLDRNHPREDTEGKA